MTRLLLAMPLLLCVDQWAIAGEQEPLTLTPATIIAVPNGEVERYTEYAAGVLHEWLRKATHSKGFQVVPERRVPASADTPVLAVGRTKWASVEEAERLWQDGYLIRRRGNVISIVGGRPTGTFHGAVAFLDRFCGVRFYMPTELFTSLPADGRIVVRDVALTVEPFVKSCYMSGIDHDNLADAKWVRRVGGWRRLGGTHQHNMYNVFPTEKYAARYPEIYPILDGKRYFPKSQKDQAWQPCFSAARLVDAGVESAAAFFKERQHCQYLSFSVQDSHRFCECPRCLAVVERHLAKDPKLGRARAHSLLYWQFMNRLAERLEQRVPGKLITGIAYSEVRLAPPFKLHPNIVLFTNYHLAELPCDGFMKPGEAGVSPLDNWLDICSHYGNHDWYQGGGYLMPRIYSGFWSKFMKHLKKRVSDAYMHAECYPNWGLDGPKLYILSRLWWDPDENVEELLSQFCRDLFGPAAASMNEYFVALERLWYRLNITEGPERKLFRWNTQFLTTEESRKKIRRGRELLDQSAALAATPKQRRRIELFSSCFRMSEYLFEIAASGSPSKERYREAEQYIDELVKREPLSYHWPKVGGAAKAVYWTSIRGVYRPLLIPKIGTPSLDGSVAGEWQRAAVTGQFLLKDGGEDPRKTQARLGHDASALYISVTCPRQDLEKLIETDDKSWRSDNVELFVDSDGNKWSFERHLWVKTNGRVVDWPPQPRPGADRIRGRATKGRDRYVIQMALPFEYLGVSPSSGARVRIQLLRNEFVKGTTRNELAYSALWSGELTME